MAQLVLFPLGVCFPCSQHYLPHPRGAQCWGRKGWSGYSVWVRAQALVVQPQSEFQIPLDLLPPQLPAMAALVPFICLSWFKQAHPSQLCTPLGCCSPCLIVELLHGARGETSQNPRQFQSASFDLLWV